MTHKERSDHIIEWINSHPLINVNMLCEMSGMPTSANISRALRGQQRRVSMKYIDAVEKVLKEYGYKPLKSQPLEL